MKAKHIIFIPNGRLGNAFFRYMASAVINILNPTLNYVLKQDYKSAANTNSYTFYPGLDHMGDDLYRSNDSIPAALPNIFQQADRNSAIIGFNTLGFFKKAIDCGALISNEYINPSNGHGLYVKNKITITDNNFFSLISKKLENFNIELYDYFQFDYIYLKYKPQILAYMEEHQDVHQIQACTSQPPILMRELLTVPVLPRTYTLAIHIRLHDFNGRPDFIELEHYLRLFETLDFAGHTICIIADQIDVHHASAATDQQYIQAIQDWFKTRAIPITFESNDVITDFNLMKQAKVLICSMSTLAWTAAYLSKQLELCYMPNYNFYTIADRKTAFFRQPIANTILYPVKTTVPSIAAIKPFIVTLPAAYSPRIEAQTDLIQKLAMIGLTTRIYYGVYGKDICIEDRQITWRGTTYQYNPHQRINGERMTCGEFGSAWSHLNLLRQFVAEPALSTLQYYLILEDDVELCKPIAELYELLHHLPPDTDMCHLAKSDSHNFVRTQAVNSYFYECKKEFFNRTTAYLVSRKGAQKILAYAGNAINIPIDDLFNTVFLLSWENFRFYVPETYFFKERENFGSIIGTLG